MDEETPSMNMDPAVDDGTCTASQTECSSSVSCNDALDPAWLDMEAKNQGMDISATTFETSDLFPVGLSFGDDAAFPSLEAMDLDATLGMQSDLTTPFAQLGSPSVIPQPLSHSPKSPSTDVTEPSAGGAGAVWAAAPPPSDSLDMALDMLSGATKPPSAAMMRSWPPVPATPGASSGSQMLYASALPQPPAQPMPKATFLPFLVTPSPPERSAMESAALTGKRAAPHAVEETPAKRAKSAVLSPDEWEQRRQRHNEIEVGRRKLLNQSFDHLQQLVKAPEGTKDSILRKAIDVLKSYEKRLKSMQEQKEALEVARQAKAQGEHHTKATAATLPQGHHQRVDGDNLHYHAFLHSGVAMSVSLIDGRLVEVNEEFATMVQNKPENLTNLSVFTMTHPDYTPRCYEVVGRLIAGEQKVADGEKKIIDCTGQPLSVHVTTWVVRENGAPKYIVAKLVPLEVQRKGAPLAGTHAHVKPEPIAVKSEPMQ